MPRGSLLAAALACGLSPALLLGACGASKSSPSGADATAPSSPPSVGAANAPGTTEPSSTGAAAPAKAKPECGKLPQSTVELPPTDGGLMNNAQPDASFDRNSNDITTSIQASRDRFRCCYDWALKEHPGIQGSFILTFTLNPDGSFKSAAHDTAKSDIKDPLMGECALDVLRALSFPPSKKGKETTVAYPFRFTPKGAAR